MTRPTAIVKATKMAFKRGASVRFTTDGMILVVLRESRRSFKALAGFAKTGEGYSEVAVASKTFAESDLRSIPTPEPEEEDGQDIFDEIQAEGAWLRSAEAKGFAGRE